MKSIWSGPMMAWLTVGTTLFYLGLLASEARHFQHYVAFAKTECGVGDEEIEARLAELKAIEAALITDPDPQFRFHSGTPL